MTRRSFMQAGAAAFAGVSIVPRHVLGGPGYRPPSDKITLACIGVGSQGLRVMMDFLGQQDVQIVSVCDVNQGSGDFVEWGAGELRGKVRRLLGDDAWGVSEGAWAGLAPAQDVVQRYYANEQGTPDYTCAAYTDYRELLEKEESVDGVVVCTPDHLHAVVSIAAMQHGKHVFCQKPMAHTIQEAKAMADAARAAGVATQVATGNSASEATRLLCEWIWDGAIGPVREVHNWSTRPFWPQGIEVPSEEEPVPDHLNWDLWLGPTAYRPYHAAYQPFVWRGWYDFGTNSIGDMGCYSFDTIFRVLKLGAPDTVEASSTTLFPASYPLAGLVHFSFPAREEMPPVTIHWYDGRLRPPKPEEVSDEELPEEGLLFVGDRGKILCGFNGGQPRLIPEAAMNAYQQPPQTLPRSIGHYEEWIAACKGEAVTPGANFAVAQPVTDAILLGNIAIRAEKTIRWDGHARTITEPADANALLHVSYRDGWAI